MVSKTVTAVLEAPRGDVFAFLSAIDNLPEWATEFARELRDELFESQYQSLLHELDNLRRRFNGPVATQ